MIIDNPADHYGVSRETDPKNYPISPQIIEGRVHNRGHKTEYPDTEKQLDELKKSGQAFEMGAGYGHNLAESLFITDIAHYGSLVQSYVDAGRNFIDRTPFGKSDWVIKYDALMEIDISVKDYDTPTSINEVSLKRRTAYQNKAYGKWKPALTESEKKPSFSEFQKLTKQVANARLIISGSSLPAPPQATDQLSKKEIAGFQDGFRRGFNVVAQPITEEPDFKSKFWYLIKS